MEWSLLHMLYNATESKLTIPLNEIILTQETTVSCITNDARLYSMLIIVYDIM